MFSRGHVLKDWLPPVALLRGGGTFKKQGLVSESEVIGEGPLEETSAPWSLPLSLALLPGCHEVSSFAPLHVPCLEILCLPRTENNRIN